MSIKTNAPRTLRVHSPVKIFFFKIFRKINLKKRGIFEILTNQMFRDFSNAILILLFLLFFLFAWHFMLSKYLDTKW